MIERLLLDERLLFEKVLLDERVLLDKRLLFERLLQDKRLLLRYFYYAIDSGKHFFRAPATKVFLNLFERFPKLIPSLLVPEETHLKSPLRALKCV